MLFFVMSRWISHLKIRVRFDSQALTRKQRIVPHIFIWVKSLGRVVFNFRVSTTFYGHKYSYTRAHQLTHIPYSSRKNTHPRIGFGYYNSILEYRVQYWGMIIIAKVRMTFTMTSSCFYPKTRKRCILGYFWRDQMRYCSIMNAMKPSIGAIGCVQWEASQPIRKPKIEL